MTKLLREIEKAVDALMFPSQYAQTFNHAVGTTTYPPFNILRRGHAEIVLEIAVAGFEEDEISVTVDNGHLSVSGNKKAQEEVEDYLYKGIGTRAFTKTFVLPKNVQGVSAEYADGILSVSVAYKDVDKNNKVNVPITRRTAAQQEFLTE